MKNQRIRLFKSNFLEKFTVAHPCIPAIVFMPVTLFFLVHIQINVSSLGYIFLGIICWTLIEYSLHRFVFHLPIKKNWAKKASYYLHGVHHEAPNDPWRLVVPPIMSISIYSFLLYLFSKLIPSNYLPGYMIGFTVGYLCYDYLHWAIHNRKIKAKLITYLRRNHALHHYSQETQRFGVTSPIWDIVFGTYSPKPLTKEPFNKVAYEDKQ